jgi:cellulose synthase/poly-beta-1,6-N-acetylglucosamine synthase-like glycosyltransferase
MIAFCLLLGIGMVYIAIQIWQLIILFRYKHHYQPEPAIWPEISILIAARNEEANIRQCLNSLLNLDYPKDRLHIICGNDQSTDHTGVILAEYSALHPHIKSVMITDDDSGLKAKARVMAQLEVYATGEFYLITDADITVKPEWAKFMVRSMTDEMGVCSGTTVVKSHSKWGTMQEIDWAYFMGMLNIISYNGVPATAVGNNMIVRSKAYHEVGGYRGIKFSITEDYKLYSEICKKGWKWDNIMQAEVTAYSAPVSDLTDLLHQRKRWLSGGKELPWYWWVLFGVFGLFYFSIPVLLFIDPATGCILWFIKWLIQTLQIRGIFNQIKEPHPRWHDYLMYEMFITINTILTAIFSIIPFGTRWKNRTY